MQKSRRWLPLFGILGEILLVLAVFTVQGAWPVPDSNEPYYVGKAIHHWNPQWIPNDPFLETPDSHTVFYFTFGWMSVFLSPDVLTWTGRFVTWTLLAVSWFRLSRTLLPVPFTSVLTAAGLVFFNDRFQMAGEWFVGGFESKGIAFAFVFFGIQSMLVNRWNRCWVFLGVASAFHVLVGGWAVLATLFALMLLHSGPHRDIETPQDELPSILKMLPCLLLGGGISLLGVIPVLLLDFHTTADVLAQARYIYVFERLPHHLVPQSFPLTFVVRAALLVIVWLCICCPMVYSILFRNYQAGSQIAGVQLSRVIRFQTFVIGTIVITLIGMCIAFGMAHQPMMAANFLRFYWFRLMEVMLPAGVAVFSIIAFLDIANRLWQQCVDQEIATPVVGKTIFAQLGLGVAVFVGIHFLLFGTRLIRWEAPSDIVISLELTLLAAGVFVFRLSFGILTRLGRLEIETARFLLFLIFGLIAPWLYLVDMAVLRTEPYHSRREPAAMETEWVAACQWIAESDIPKDGRFLVPRDVVTFKWHAHRPDIGVWKEAPQDAVSLVDWREKMRFFFEGYDEHGDVVFATPQVILKVRSPPEIAVLRKTYGFDFVLCTKYPRLNYPVLYENDRYIVYDFR